MSDLGGRLRVRPGAPLPTISSTRPLLAGRLARGRPAGQLGGVMAALFSLCGAAHRVAADHAVQAALAGSVAPDGRARASLCADTLREHLRRLWLDLPSTVDLPGPDPADLAGCPLMRGAAVDDATREWVEHHVFGQSAATWLQAWHDGPLEHVAGWSAARATWPARWLQCLKGRCGAPLPVVPLLPHASAHERRRLALELWRDEAFAATPLWRGHTAETGTWTRLAARGTPAAADPWMRHAARLADIAQLLQPGGADWLSQGGQALHAGHGLGWCEMARGLLLYTVGLDADERVLDCRVLAPTEWNFHPMGPAARALAALPADAPALRVRALLAAYDPCVGVDIDRALEPSHA